MKTKKISKFFIWVIAASMLTLVNFPSKASAENSELSLTKITDLSISSAASHAKPDRRAAIGSTLFFVATSNSTGAELWKWSRESGVVLVKDIYPGTTGSNPQNLTVLGATLLFSASDGSSGTELWKSDGTAAGTVIVKEIRPGGDGGSPLNFKAVGDTLYFAANGLDESGTPTGNVLWKSDGTETGTVLVKEIAPGISPSSPQNLTVLGSTLFFRATDGTSGNELWKSDGTETGTVRVKDIYPGISPSSPQNLTVLGSTLFFRATDGTSGNELWKSDGTETGTVLVKEIAPGSNSSSPSVLTVVGDTLYFSANDPTTGVALWKSDGTETGTVLVKDINPTLSSFLPVYTPSPVAYKGALYFSASDTPTSNYELWKSDGTETGTVRVKDIFVGNSGSTPYNLIVLGEFLYFTANDGTSGNELWKSDGTETGTVLVNDIVVGITSSYPGDYNEANGVPSDGNFLKSGSQLFFVANDGDSREWWVLDSNPTVNSESNPGPSLPKPAPIVIPDPPQTSSIVSASSECAIGMLFEVQGVFDRQVTNVSIDGVNIPYKSWSQTSSTVNFQIPSNVSGQVKLQIFNGAVPLLPSIECTAVTALTPRPDPVVTPTPEPVVTPAPTPEPEVTPTPGPVVTPSPTPTEPETSEPEPAKSIAGNQASKKLNVFYAMGSSSLDAKAKRILRATVNEITSEVKGVSGVRVRVTGWVQPTRVSPNVDQLSRARAKAVVDYLKSMGFEARFSISAPGHAKVNDAKSRRASVVISWTKQGS